MCRMMYLLTAKPLSGATVQLQEAPGVSMSEANPEWVPDIVRQLPHGAIYQIYAAQGCGCGFGVNDSGTHEQWQADMQGLQRLLMRVAQEQGDFTLCTGWDFDAPVAPRSIKVDQIAAQVFETVFSEEGDEWDFLQVKANSTTPNISPIT